MLVSLSSIRSPSAGRWRFAAWAVAVAAAATVIATQTRTAAPDEAPDRPTDALSVTQREHAQRENAQRLAWIVERVQPVVADGTIACLTAGPACGWDEMTATDTTALRAASLATSLSRATEPGSAAYLGDQGEDVHALVERTVAAAAGLADELRRWLSSGCGSNVDGVEVTTPRPSECPTWAAAAQDGAARLTAALAEWPAP